MLGRIILFVTCGTYLLSAGLLCWAKFAGKPVTSGSIAGWAVTGLVGTALIPLLGSGRWLAIAVEALVLIPWMAWATFGDFRAGHTVMGIFDISGLFAIAWALWLVSR